MKIDIWGILLRAFFPLALQTLLYFLAFKVRRIDIKLLNCIIIGGSAYLVGIIPIPLPAVLRIGFTIGLAMFLIARYTEAELFPDTILIPVIVQLLASLIESLISF